MKKGFTLIELLAVIIVIGVIAVITIPAYNNAIKAQRDKAFVESERGLIRGLINYLTFNEDLIPKNINDTNIVSIKSLQDLKFINEIKSPLTGNNCSGYITIIKNVDDKLTFNPYYRCNGTTVENPASDNLVLNYPFTDYQEPTVNLFPHDGSFETATGMHIGDPLNSNGITTLIGGGYRCGTHFNDGICKVESGGLYGDKTLNWYHNDVSGWKGTTLTSSYSLTAGKTYTISVNTRINQLNPSSQSAYAFYGPDGYRYYFSWEKTPHQNPNEWILGTRTITPDINVTGGVYLYGISTANPGTIVSYDGFQVEEKPYATPYTESTREGVVIDNTSSGKNSVLTMQRTPRHVKERGGSYLFNGTNTFIEVPNHSDFALPVGTISIWVKPTRLFPSDTTSTSFRGIVSKTTTGGTGGSSFYIDWNGTNTSRTLRAAIGDATGSNSITVGNFDFKQEWNHIVFKWDSTKLYLYSNGNKIGETNQTRIVQNLNKTVEIGRAFNSNSYVWDGYLDDVKIYSRVLSEEEIKNLYAIEKLKS